MPRGPMYVLADPVYTTSSWYTRCFSGLRAEVSRLDILLLQVRSINEVPNDGSVRTCVLFGSDARWARHTVTALNARGIRSVLAGAQPDAFYGASGTTLDRRLLVEDMVRYFVANGRRRLACLGGVPWNVNDAVRVAAFHQAMRAAGLSSGESDVFSAGEGIDACAARMLERAGAYDGALCVNDQVGVRLLALAREKGVRVPEDLFVMGSGNFLVGELSVPTLTTSEVDYYLMGRKTVDVWQYIDRRPDVEAATVTIRTASSRAAARRFCRLPARCVTRSCRGSTATAGTTKRSGVWTGLRTACSAAMRWICASSAALHAERAWKKSRRTCLSRWER